MCGQGGGSGCGPGGGMATAQQGYGNGWSPNGGSYNSTAFNQGMAQTDQVPYGGGGGAQGCNGGCGGGGQGMQGGQMPYGVSQQGGWGGQGRPDMGVNQYDIMRAGPGDMQALGGYGGQSPAQSQYNKMGFAGMQGGGAPSFQDALAGNYQAQGGNPAMGMQMAANQQRMQAQGGLGPGMLGPAGGAPQGQAPATTAGYQAPSASAVPPGSPAAMYAAQATGNQAGLANAGSTATNQAVNSYGVGGANYNPMMNSYAGMDAGTRQKLQGMYASPQAWAQATGSANPNMMPSSWTGMGM